VSWNSLRLLTPYTADAQKLGSGRNSCKTEQANRRRATFSILPVDHLPIKAFTFSTPQVA
jgi:hypothetical protein